MNASIDFVTTPDGVTVGTLLDCTVGEAEAVQVRDAFCWLLAEPAVKYVVLDCSRVEDVGASLIDPVIWLHLQLKARGGRLALCRPKGLPEQLFAAGFDQWIPVVAGKPHSDAAEDLADAESIVLGGPARHCPRQWIDGVLVIQLRDPRYISWSRDEPGVFQEHVKEVVAAIPDPPWVVFDLSDQRDFSHTVLYCILYVRRSVIARGGELLICELQPRWTAAVMEIDSTGGRLLKYLGAEATVASAVARLAARAAGLKTAPE